MLESSGKEICLVCAPQICVRGRISPAAIADLRFTCNSFESAMFIFLRQEP